MMFKRYLILFFSLFAGFILVAAGLNIAVDPYGMWGTKRVEGISDIKPFIGDRGRIAKRYQVERIQPKTVIMGNSRPEIGLRPDHACWPGDIQPVYNLSLPGLGFRQQIRYTQHALEVAPVELVLLNVDFLDFLDPAVPTEEGDLPVRDPYPLAVDPDGAPSNAFQRSKGSERAGAAFSLDSATHSLLTISASLQGKGETRTELGYNPGTRLYNPIVQRDGTAILFAEKNKTLRNTLARQLRLLDTAEQDWPVEFNALRQLIEQVKKEGGEVRLFINPYHAQYYEILDNQGYWPAFEEWVRAVTELAEQEDVRLWDFTSFATEATLSPEGLAKRGEAHPWFWEPSHYRAVYGDRMLDQMLGDVCTHPVEYIAVGRELSRESLYSHLEMMRTGLEAYLDEMN